MELTILWRAKKDAGPFGPRQRRRVWTRSSSQSAVGDLLPIKRQYDCQRADRRRSPTPPPRTRVLAASTAGAVLLLTNINERRTGKTIPK